MPFSTNPLIFWEILKLARYVQLERTLLRRQTIWKKNEKNRSHHQAV